MTADERQQEQTNGSLVRDRGPDGTGTLGWATHTGVAGVPVLLGLLVGLWNLGGLMGVVAWVGLVITWLFFPPVTVVAVGQFALAAVTPTDVTVMAVLPIEGVLLALLAVDLVLSNPLLFDSEQGFDPQLPRLRLQAGLVYVVTAAVLTGIVLWTADIQGLVAAGLTGTVLVATAAYFLHRYLLYHYRGSP
jgi:hypothetical protein